MTTTSYTPGDGSERPTEVLPALGEDSILGTTAADRCNVCGSEMAPDQSYCVECGTRRGRPRFTLESARRAAAAGTGSGAVLTAPASGGVGGSPRRGWWASSASATLVAGVAVLLLAIGVGFEIGHAGRPASNGTGATRVVVDGGGGGTPASGASGSTGTAGSGSAKGRTGTPRKAVTSKKALAKAISKAPPKQVVAKESQAANKVLHTKSGVKIAPPTTGVGGKCSAGTAGCQNGKLTGANFFGNS